MSDERSASVRVQDLSLKSLYDLWRQRCNLALRWDCLFTAPPWLENWQRYFGRGRPLQLTGVFHGSRPIGIAPLIYDGPTARFAGDVHVCDYLDFIVEPGREILFFNTLLEHLRRRGIRSMDLRAVRADAAVFTGLAVALASRGIAIDSVLEDESLALMLPPSWPAYLQGLKGKQRHEVRRKLRRLHESGSIQMRTVAAAAEVDSAMDVFAALFTASRDDKFRFWEPTMAAFFRSLAAAMAREGLLNLMFLELNTEAAAAVMCFDYHRVRYLYNSGYDRRFRHLSVGLLSKVFSLRQAIGQGLERYDFLKGSEVYKERLGGAPTGIYRCRCEL